MFVYAIVNVRDHIVSNNISYNFNIILLSESVQKVEDKLKEMNLTKIYSVTPLWQSYESADNKNYWVVQIDTSCWGDLRDLYRWVKGEK